MDYTMNDNKKEYNDKNLYSENDMKKDYTNALDTMLKNMFLSDQDLGLNKMLCSYNDNKTNFFYHVFLILLSEQYVINNIKTFTKTERMRDIYRCAELAMTIMDLAFEFGDKITTPDKFLDNLKKKIED